MAPRSLNSTSLPDSDTPPPPPRDPTDDAEEQLSAEATDLAVRLEALEPAASERAADLSSSSRARVVLEEPAESSSPKPWWSPPRGWRVAFSTATISDTLERLDDSIVRRLRGRALYCYNNEAYYPQCYPIIQSNGEHLIQGSLFQYLHFEDEKLHAQIGRYKFSSYETPFRPSLLMEPIMAHIPWRLRQALSNRIHYGKSVAESKFLEEPEKYTPAIREQDKDKLIEILTDPDAEEEVITRVKNKAMVYGQKVDPELVGELYDKLVIPMTKEVQVQYLLRRLDLV